MTVWPLNNYSIFTLFDAIASMAFFNWNFWLALMAFITKVEPGTAGTCWKASIVSKINCLSNTDLPSEMVLIMIFESKAKDQRKASITNSTWSTCHIISSHAVWWLEAIHSNSWFLIGSVSRWVNNGQYVDRQCQTLRETKSGRLYTIRNCRKDMENRGQALR